MACVQCKYLTRVSIDIMVVQYDLKYSTNTRSCHFVEGENTSGPSRLVTMVCWEPLCSDLHVDVSLTHTIHLNCIAEQPPSPHQPYHKALAWPSNPAGIPVQESIHGMQLNHGCISPSVPVPGPTDTSPAPLETSGQVSAVSSNKVGASASGKSFYVCVCNLQLADGEFSRNYS